MDRRQFLSGLGAATVIGFNPVAKRWVRAAFADEGSFTGLPPLDGQVVTDPASRAADQTDAGNIVQKIPRAVLRPGSVEDIVRMVRFCRCHGIRVSARGQGHTTFGQSLSPGLIIEMSSLATIHSFDASGADLDAGVMWKDLLQVSVPAGLAPPVLTGFTGLSIGGTLSVGGISSTNAQGAQVDRVQELEVVTGEGERVRCSRRHRRELFEVVLSGLGQCAIITRARVDMIPVPLQARQITALYADNATFFADLRALLDRGELTDVFNIWAPDGHGGFLYQLNAALPFDPTNPPDTDYLMRGLHYLPGTIATQDMPYLQYVLRVDAVIDIFKQVGLWEGVIHPWLDVFLPDQTIEQYVAEVLPTLTSADIGPAGFMLLFPQKRASLRRPFFRVPDNTDWVYLFDILGCAPAPGPNPTFVDQMLARNRRLFDRAVALGGTHYPIGSIPLERADWVAHYGSRWPDLVWLKRRFDPDFILSPGAGIF